MSKRLELNTNLLLFAATVIALGAIRHIYRLILLVQANLSAAPFLAVTTLIWLEMFLLFSFLFGSCLVFRTKTGLLCSMFGLVGVLLGYAGWFTFTHKELQIFSQNPFYLEHPELVPQNFFGLLGGGWWDILLLIPFVILLVWEIKVLVNACAKGSAISESWTREQGSGIANSNQVD